MVRKFAVSVARMPTRQAWHEIQLLGKAEWIIRPRARPPKVRGVRNLLIDPDSVRYYPGEAKNRGQKKAQVERIIDALVSRGGWVTPADIGTRDYENITHVIFNLEQITERIRSKLQCLISRNETLI